MRTDAPGCATPPAGAVSPPAAASRGAPAPPATASEELGKLRWRCRRGMKELDILLARYLDERFCAAPRSEQDRFRQLLEAPDPLLYAYCLGSEPPPRRFAALIERITANSSIER